MIQVVDGVCLNSGGEGRYGSRTVPVRWTSGEGGTRTNASVTLSPASCVAPCHSDDIWHRLQRVGGLSAFDACTNCAAETRASKCFDAISQQSVKQKTFVAFYAPREKQCQHKRTPRSVGGR